MKEIVAFTLNIIQTLSICGASVYCIETEHPNFGIAFLVMAFLTAVHYTARDEKGDAK